MVKRVLSLHQHVTDVLVLAGIGAVVAVLLRAEPVRTSLPPSTIDLLTLGAAGVGAGAAILAAVAAHLLDDVRPAWIAAALVLYCAVVLPWSTVLATQPGGDQRAPLLVTYLAAVTLLVLAIRPPAVLGWWGAWVICALGGVLGVLVLNLPDAAAVRVFVDGPVPTVVALAGWTAVAVAFAVAGLRSGNAPRLRLGLGLIVLAAAQLYRVAEGGGRDLAFAGLRLVGLTVVLVGLGQVVLQALRRLQSLNWEQQEALAAATVHLERAREAAADRDHELRNGLAGLAGITHLLGTDPEDDERRALKHAVLAELGRLLTLVDGPVDGTGPDPPAAGYPVEQVLNDRVALREATCGPDAGPLDLRVDADLRIEGDPDLLAQVLTNVLANCERHAYGAPITVTATADGDRVRIEVRDEGPGLPAGVADAVLDRGVRDESAGGSGLGLHICAGLAARAGGEFTVKSCDAPTGCLVALTLPRVVGITKSQPVIAEGRPSGVTLETTDNR